MVTTRNEVGPLCREEREKWGLNDSDDRQDY